MNCPVCNNESNYEMKREKREVFNPVTGFGGATTFAPGQGDIRICCGNCGHEVRVQFCGEGDEGCSYLPTIDKATEICISEFQRTDINAKQIPLCVTYKQTGVRR